jgi:hypothetical protein
VNAGSIRTSVKCARVTVVAIDDRIDTRTVDAGVGCTRIVVVTVSVLRALHTKQRQGVECIDPTETELGVETGLPQVHRPDTNGLPHL